MNALSGIRRRIEAGPAVGRIDAAGTVTLDTRRTSTLRPTGWGVGIQRLTPAEFPVPPVDVWSREAAMSVPSISRARDLLCSAVASLPLTLWSLKWDQPNRRNVEEQIPPALWMNRPDPNRTRQFILSWTCDDLLFLARSYWKVTKRYESTGYPAAFEWMPAADVNIDATGKITFLGKVVPAEDVVEFLSPLDGLLFTGWRAIQTAVNLDAAAERFSTAEIPAGWLAQRENSEPMTVDELTSMAELWAAARQQRTTAALNPYLEYHESAMDPSRLQLVEARQHQAVELARVANIPAYFLNAPAGTGMTYMNTAQAKQDLVDFGAMPFIGAIEQTLGGPNVTPNGQAVRLDLSAWLRNPYTPNDNASPNDLQIAYNAPPATNGDRAPGRPRDIDGRNEGVRQ